MCCLSSSSSSTSEWHLLFVSMFSCPADAKKIASVCSPFRGTPSALLATVIRFAFRFTCNDMSSLPFVLKRFRVQDSMQTARSYGVKASPCIRQRSLVIILSFLVSLIHVLLFLWEVHTIRISVSATSLFESTA